MKKFSIYFIATFVPIASALAVDFPASNNIQPLSKYGQIQNVQNYSSNPFWGSNSPYNQRMPQAIYAQGAALNAAECQSVVSQLVASVCSGRNNCTGTNLNDVKPTIMVQLSKMPENNYVSACSGFIDSAFSDYVAKYGSAVQGTNFPTALNPGNNSNEQNDFKPENPYALKSPQWHGEEWFGEIVGRTKELNNLQAQNAEDTTLTATQMPETIADLSFQERMDNAADGYADWKCDPKTGVNCSYKQLNIEKDETYWQREQQKPQNNPNYLNNNNNNTLPKIKKSQNNYDVGNDDADEIVFHI
ncbi:MAG: hypothetical protein JW974_00770 [Alphaproteobacteria bacterium]|nr:hypothetical protein [Alphaproteobacteria bacterium]MBN2674978.1 hypothetical protein [Alphaproteobacteria bacterium]